MFLPLLVFGTIGAAWTKETLGTKPKKGVSAKKKKTYTVTVED